MAAFTSDASCLLVFPGKVVPFLCVARATMSRPPIIDHSRHALEGLKTAVGFLLNKGENGHHRLH